jgi:hypothetical protein
MMRDRPVVCDAMRDVMRDRLKARETAIWTNAPLVRSARGAGGARSESGNPRISGEPGRDQALLQSNAVKAGFGKAVERLPAYRR